MTTTALTLRKTITEIVRVYEDTVKEVQESFARIAAADKRLNEAFTMDHWSSIHLRGAHHRGMDFSDPSDVLANLKKDVWHALVERLELRRMLSVKRSKELEQHLEKGDLPDITEANVFEFVQFYIEHLDDMLTEAVAEVFDFLRPHRSRHKTNTELEIGRRVILVRTVETGWSGGFRVHYHRQPQLTALENVFQALDGKGSISKHHYSTLQIAIEAAKEGCGETEYFAFRCYQNGNLHLEFRRPDLVTQLNRTAGGARLRPATVA